ncbi:hypothetical protein [Butyrivibrio sp. XBB1001]|uniref:hypothetical protein n=1 Tax=Butyrivibrio sp. XBB1001 TaxID=1280682 RepID=UPI00047EC7CD|nr:hypothetical protein [Butyrivibrio sp. XBB1001]
MMIKLLNRGVVLGLTAAVLFSVAPAQTVAAADVAPLHTSVTVDGRDSKQTVTYDLNLDTVTTTDGRVAVTYDPEVLELTKAADKVNFDIEDFNSDYSDEDSKGVAFAYVNAKPKSRSGKVLHVKFAVKDWTKAQDTVIKTEVFGINNEDQEVVPATVIEDQVSVGRNKPVTPQNVTATQVVGGVEIKWTKDENADYYVVYRAKAEEGPYQKIGTSKGDSLLNVFVGQKDYYYKVVAHQTGSPSYDSEPSAPVKVTVTKLLGVIGG